MALHLTRSDGQKDEDNYLEDVESTLDEEEGMDEWMDLDESILTLI